MKKITRNNQQGFIAFTSLLVVSTVILAIAISLPLLGVNELNTSLGYSKSQYALKVAESCAEEALIRLRDDVNYSGGSLTIGDGSCNISVSGAGSDRTISVDATVTVPPDYIKHLQITVKRTGNSINIIDWTEI